MSREIHHLQLTFAFFLWLFLHCRWTFGDSNSNKSFQWTFGESNSNKSLQICWVSETRQLVSTLRLRSLILSPQIRLRETREWNTYFGLGNSKIVYQNSTLFTIPIFNMIKVNRYGNQRKYLELREKSVNPKNNRYLFTYLENRPKSRLHHVL